MIGHNTHVITSLAVPL